MSLTVESGVSSRSDSEMSDVGSEVVLDGVGRFAAELLSPGELDVIMERVRGQNLCLVGEGGVLSLLSKKILERALEEERTEHLGYERGDAAGRGSGNSRNGTTPKRVLTDAGPVDLDVPRDRAGTFEPRIVPTGVTRLAGFSDTIVAWYTNGHVHPRHPPSDPAHVRRRHFGRARLSGHRRSHRRAQRLASHGHWTGCIRSCTSTLSW